MRSKRKREDEEILNISLKGKRMKLNSFSMLEMRTSFCMTSKNRGKPMIKSQNESMLVKQGVEGGSRRLWLLKTAIC